MNFLIIFPDWGYFPLPYRRTIPPLSPAVLAGILRDYGEVKFVDERLEKVPFEEQFDVVFISAMTNQIARAHEIAQKFRERGILVALGGIHPSLLPEGEKPFADVLFVGEAEETLPRFLEDLLKGEVKPEYLCLDLEYTTERFYPDRSIYPGRGYLPIDPILLFKGCRLSCEACSVPQVQGRSVYFRNLEKVLEEIDKGCDYLFLVNDDLFYHRQSLRPFFDELATMNKSWLGLGSLEMAHEEKYLEEMKRSGCWLLYLDFGPREAMALNHPDRMKSTRKQMQRRIELIKRMGIKLIGSFTFGYDFDTPDIFNNTLEFCDENNIDEAEFHVLVPYPQSRLALKLNKGKRLVSTNWARYTATEVVFQPKNMSIAQLEEGYFHAWRSFYNLESHDKTSEFEIESLRAFPQNKPYRITY